LTILMVIPAMAGGAPADDYAVTSTAVSSNPSDVVNYWRADNGRNMNEAREMTMPLGRRRRAQDPAAARLSPGGPLLALSGSTGGRGAGRAVQRMQPMSLRLDAPTPNAGTFPFSFDRYRLFPNTEAQYKTYPYRTVGKLFFNIGASRFVCSASVVTSFNTSVVWTAGHCVYTPGTGFHSNWLFVPAQRRVGVTPTSPYGDWTALYAVVLTVWTTGLLEYDHGALIMNRSTDTGQTIGETVGMLGFMANAPRQQQFHAAGYPAAPHSAPSYNPQFTGFHHEICDAGWAANDLPTGGGSDPPTIGIGCDQTGGSSGGPWIVDFNSLAVSTSGGGNPVALNLLNGNNSYRYSGGPPNNLRMFSPYFSNGAIVLRDFAENVDVP
jgi:hypothetical protein